MKKLTQRQLDKFKELVESEDDTVNQVLYDFANDEECRLDTFEVLLEIVKRKSFQDGEDKGWKDSGESDGLL